MNILPITPDSSVLSVCDRLRNTQEFVIIQQHLKKNLDSLDEANRLRQDVDLYRSQGIALAIKAILDLLSRKETTKGTVA